MRDQVLALVSKYLHGHIRQTGGGNVITKCPFHKGGDERRPSFSINLDKGLYHCFTGGCIANEGGNLYQLLKLLQVPQGVLENEMRLIKPHLEAASAQKKMEKAHLFETRDPFSAPFVLPESILGIYDFCPVFLRDSGFDETILRRMEVGYDVKKERITYPVRDMYGTLAGFSAGATSRTPNPVPKYKVYQGQRKDLQGRVIPSDYGEWFDKWFPDYAFENHNFLWNFHNVWKRHLEHPDSFNEIYVVEGFKACLWMLQAGFEATVALMGSSVSEIQQNMLYRMGRTVILCLDNDPPGRSATIRCGRRLFKPLGGNLRVLAYPDEDKEVDTQPDDYEIESLRWMVANSRSYLDHITKLRINLREERDR